MVYVIDRHRKYEEKKEKTRNTYEKELLGFRRPWWDDAIELNSPDLT